jgi:hypothetical protein
MTPYEIPAVVDANPVLASKAPRQGIWAIRWIGHAGRSDAAPAVPVRLPSIVLRQRSDRQIPLHVGLTNTQSRIATQPRTPRRSFRL